MKLNIIRLKDRNKTGFTFQMSHSLEPLSVGGEQISFEGPVQLEGTVESHDDIYMVSAEIKAVVILKCSRCLKEFPHSISTSFRQKYREGADAEEVLGFRADTIDLTVPVTESIILDLPIKGLCKEDCKGICPVCGTDRNEKECDCKQQDIDPRLASLKEFFKH